MVQYFYFEFPPGWWIITGIILFIYIALLFQRKSYAGQREAKAQLLFGFVVLALSFLFEVIAVSLDVWTYYPGNWPVILWPTYFLSGLLGYQLVKKIEEIING